MPHDAGEFSGPRGLAWATGYLGGHLSFGLGSGIGPRGGLEQSTTDSARAA